MVRAAAPRLRQRCDRPHGPVAVVTAGASASAAPSPRRWLAPARTRSSPTSRRRRRGRRDYGRAVPPAALPRWGPWS